MAQTLVTQIIERLGSGTIDQLSSTVGIDRGTAQKAVSGAVPAILAGLVGLASRPGGADRLSSALGQLGNLGISEGAVQPIVQAGQQPLVEQGSSLLSSLFGGQSLDGLVGAVAHFAGIDQGAAVKLLGLVTPLVLGFLARRAEPPGTGAAGLANMLLDQKDAIIDALPPGLANRLQGSGLLSGVADRLSQGAEAAATTATSSAAAMSQGISAATSAVSDFGAKAAQSAASHADARQRSFGQLPRWLLGLAAVAIVVIAAYWLWGRGGVQEASRLPAETSAQTAGAGTSTAVGQLDLGQRLAGAFDHTRLALEQVSDPESAKRALPQLNDVIAQLEKLRDAAAQAPPQEWKSVADLIGKTQPGLQDAIDRVLARPGVAEVLKPTLDAFKSKLAALTSA